MICVTKKDILDIWYLFDTGVKYRYGSMKLNEQDVPKRLMDIIKSISESGGCLVAVRKALYNNTVFEGLVVRKEIDFDLLDVDYTGCGSYYTLQSEKIQKGDLGKGIDSIYIVLSGGFECERIVEFSLLEMLRATFGTEGLTRITEQAITKLNNGEEFNGWVLVFPDLLLEGLIKETAVSELLDNKYKLLYSYSFNGADYLIVGEKDLNSEIHLNILKYEEEKARRKYILASEIKPTDDRFIEVVDFLLDYSPDTKHFKGLGLDLTMSNTDFYNISINKELFM